MITPTSEQYKAIQAIKAWFSSSKKSKQFVLSGLAGSGKTTILQYVIEDLGLKDYQIRFCSFTGKAADVMRKKGLENASTIHSLIYEPRTIDEESGKVEWRLKSHLGTDVKLIVVDEASTIGKDLQKDLESFNKPILYVGDGAQLPPVGDGVINLMFKPDFRLETIMRQALENPIIWIANQARLGKYIKHGKYGSTVLKTSPDRITPETMKRADQILCGKNITRRHINSQMRDFLGFKSAYPLDNDKLICLKNNRSSGLINGMTGKCLYYDDKKHILDFKTDDNTFYDLKVDHKIFHGTKSEKYNRLIEEFDYGYCITVYKFQGSQADNVIICQERTGDNDFMKRWNYTAYTRAAEKLIILE